MQREQIERKAAERYRISRCMGLVHVPKVSFRDAIRNAAECMIILMYDRATYSRTESTVTYFSDFPNLNVQLIEEQNKGGNYSIAYFVMSNQFGG